MVRQNSRLLPGKDRLHSNFIWLDSWHTFSFGKHYDPERMGFGSIRVINDDTVAPGQGFGTHAHKNMEIISYVISGHLEHKDSMGNGRIIKPGEFQYMSAGSGVEHSEFNPSKDEPVHFLQIWIEPREKGTAPRYAEKSVVDSVSGLTVVMSPDARDSSMPIHQDIELSFGRLAAGEEVETPADGAGSYVHVIKGNIDVADHTLAAGDGLALEAPAGRIAAANDTDFLYFSQK